MKANDAIISILKSTSNMLSMYLADLSDADLLVRPVPNANHIAWQIGHLITSEAGLVKSQGVAANYPELPAGFAERHKNEESTKDSGFATKAVYLDLFNKTREASIAAAGKLSESDLDKATTGQMASFAPKLGDLMLLVANHTMMHVGQFTPIRRKLGKPVLF
jgi:hypothetical protein